MGESENLFRCATCDLSFGEPGPLNEHIEQGRRNEFELTGAKNRQLVNGRLGEEKFQSEKSYFYHKVLRLKDKSP